MDSIELLEKYVNEENYFKALGIIDEFKNRNILLDNSTALDISKIIEIEKSIYDKIKDFGNFLYESSSAMRKSGTTFSNKYNKKIVEFKTILKKDFYNDDNNRNISKLTLLDNSKKFKQTGLTKEQIESINIGDCVPGNDNNEVLCLVFDSKRISDIKSLMQGFYHFITTNEKATYLALDFDLEDLKDNKYLKRTIFNILSLFILFANNIFDNLMLENVFLLFNSEDDIKTFNICFNNNKVKQDESIKTQTDDNKLSSELRTSSVEFLRNIKNILYFLGEQDKPILVTGETGVGKSHFAKFLHKRSPQKDKNFVSINCGTIAEERIGAELFGWKKGSFTGAIGDNEGKIKKAEGGTLFLDEIDRTSVSFRNTLLTFIEDGEYYPIGSEKSESLKTNLIFGTNKDLITLTKNKQMEIDFYYRISSRQIEIPPLRERRQDIELLIGYFIEEYQTKSTHLIEIDPFALNILKEKPWYGNIRELKNYITDLLIICKVENKNVIDENLLELHKISDRNLWGDEELFYLQNILKALLNKYDYSNGNFIENIIYPIVAKLYLEDCFTNINKTEKNTKAKEIIGIGGSDFARSVLYKAYEKYRDLIKQQ